MEPEDNTAPAAREDNDPDHVEDQSPQTATTKTTKHVKVECKPRGGSKAKKKSTSHLAKSLQTRPRKSGKQLLARDTSSESSCTDSSDASCSDIESSESELESKQASKKKKHSKRHDVAKKSKNKKTGKRVRSVITPINLLILHYLLSMNNTI